MSLSLLFTGLLSCLLHLVTSQSDGGGYYPPPQQSGGLYQSPAWSAPYPASGQGGATSGAAAANSGAAATGPSGGGFFPPTGGAFLGIAPVCAKVAIALTRLHTLIEPIKALLVGAFVFFAFKNFVIPYLVYYARSVEEDEDLERSLNPATANILKVVSRGVCLERIACQLGTKAQEYQITKEVVRAIDATAATERLTSIFRAAATATPGTATSCDVYRCKNRRSHKNKPPE